MTNNSDKKKMRKRTKFTIIAIINIFWYTIAVLVLSYFDKTVPAELTMGWFAAWTVELALLYGIKVKSKDSYNDEPDSCNYSNDFIEDQIDIQDENSVSDYDNNLG